jgi:predicted N-acetyltransferase YhbS
MRSLPPVTPETSADFDEVEALIETAFGPGRLAKAAERLREGRKPAQGLSVVARDDTGVVGCTRLWTIRIGEREALLLGPFAVADRWKNRGVGAAMIDAACQNAKAAGHDLVLLVGDEAYYSRMGFAPAARGAVILPGPVDGRRVLVRALKDGAADGLAGQVTPG